LRISDVKVHVLAPKKVAFHGNQYDMTLSLVRVFTDEGLEGNFMLYGNEEARSMARPLKQTLVGLDPFDKEKFFGQYPPVRRRGYWLGNNLLCVIDVCLWDIIAKALKQPIHRLLGTCRDKVLAYASTQHMPRVEDYVETAQECYEQGFRAVKIHPPSTIGKGDWRTDIEVCRAVKQAVGEKMILLHDPVGVYDREQAIRVGRAIEKLGYYTYEDPLPTTDVEGYAELCRSLDIEVLGGEFMTSLYGYTELIRRHATDALRCVMENIGGITPTMKVAHLAEAYGMKCEPHSWGHQLTQAAHFQCMLAMYNNDFFELPVPQGVFDVPAVKDIIRVDKEGYVHAPTKPGLGLEPDLAALEKTTVRVYPEP